MTIGMFAYATLFMGISIANLTLFIKDFFLDMEAKGAKGIQIQLFGAIGLINVRDVSPVCLR